MQFGLAAGFMAPIGLKNLLWRLINLIGWVLLAIGFLIEFFYVNGMSPVGDKF